MIFYYQRTSGHWSPVKAKEAPYNGIDKGRRKFFHPWGDRGLGHRLTEDQEDLSLEELMMIFPAPKPQVVEVESDFNPTDTEKLVVAKCAITKVLEELETQVSGAIGQGEATVLHYPGPSIEDMREALRVGKQYMKDVIG